MGNKALLSSVEGIPQQVWFPESCSRNNCAGLYSKTFANLTLKVFCYITTAILINCSTVVLQVVAAYSKALEIHIKENYP